VAEKGGLTDRRPDIVLFMVDQLSAKWLEPGARRAFDLPNLDALRREGAWFTRAFTSNPLCVPARSTIATGLTTRGHGALANGYRLDPCIYTFMRALREAGYRTGGFGKIHLAPHYESLSHDYRPYGFDVVHNTEDPRAGEWLDWIRAEHPQHLANVLALNHCAHLPGFSRYGPEGIDLAAEIGRCRSAYRWTDELPDESPMRHTPRFPAELTQTSWTTRHSTDFIRSVPRGVNLFAQVSYVQPHSPFCPPRHALGRVDRAAIPEPAGCEWLDDQAAPSGLDRSEGATRGIPEDWRVNRHYYFADVTDLDDQLGRVVSTLRDAGRWDNTLLIVTSDHGELLHDHGFLGKGERHYDASIRVPLLVVGPGVKPATESDAFVQLEDICPTILDAARLEAPKHRVMGPHVTRRPCALPGRSLLPLCTGARPDGWRSAAYVESYNNIFRTDMGEWARTIRTERYRYTMFGEAGKEQLFDMASDPDEQHNLAREISAEGVRRDLRDRLLELIIAQDYPHPPRGLFSLGVH
jgi:choline-sulfatase